MTTAEGSLDSYYKPTPNGWKTSIAPEEMGLPYTLHLLSIGAGAQFSLDFRKIAPKNRMPAILEPAGPDGAPVSIFDSGAILHYRARKTGQFGGDPARAQITVEQWLMWQMDGLGPMTRQAHHCLKYLPNLQQPQILPCAQDRYRSETARLYSVLDRQLAKNRYVAGDFHSIADMSIWGWASLWEGQQQTLEDEPHVARRYRGTRPCGGKAPSRKRPRADIHAVQTGRMRGNVPIRRHKRRNGLANRRRAA